MERLALAALGGVVIPFSYELLLFVIDGYFEESTFARLITAPIQWPYWIYSAFTTRVTGVGGFLSPGLTLSLYLGNFLLYSLLTYAFLRWRSIPT